MAANIFFHVIIHWLWSLSAAHFGKKMAIGIFFCPFMSLFVHHINPNVVFETVFFYHFFPTFIEFVIVYVVKDERSKCRWLLMAVNVGTCISCYVPSAYPMPTVWKYLVDFLLHCFVSVRHYRKGMFAAHWIHDFSKGPFVWSKRLV